MKKTYYLLIPIMALVHVLMRWCEWGGHFFGRLNDRFLDNLTR